MVFVIVIVVVTADAIVIIVQVADAVGNFAAKSDDRDATTANNILLWGLVFQVVTSFVFISRGSGAREGGPAPSPFSGERARKGKKRRRRRRAVVRRRRVEGAMAESGAMARRWGEGRGSGLGIHASSMNPRV